jgi:hypothetical protein
MPGFLLHLGATVLCSHGGQATPTAPNPRVTVSDQPVVTQATLYTVAGCTLPSQAGGPDVTGQWVTGATRVSSNGQPVLLADSRAICAPTGAPLLTVVTQTRVTGT